MRGHADRVVRPWLGTLRQEGIRRQQPTGEGGLCLQNGRAGELFRNVI
jgi:hypothetical protein